MKLIPSEIYQSWQRWRWQFSSVVHSDQRFVLSIGNNKFYMFLIRKTTFNRKQMTFCLSLTFMLVNFLVRADNLIDFALFCPCKREKTTNLKFADIFSTAKIGPVFLNHTYFHMSLYLLQIFDPDTIRRPSHFRMIVLTRHVMFQLFFGNFSPLRLLPGFQFFLLWYHLWILLGDCSKLREKLLKIWHFFRGLKKLPIGGAVYRLQTDCRQLRKCFCLLFWWCALIKFHSIFKFQFGYSNFDCWRIMIFQLSTYF
jgi:hypothetical protein